MRLGVAMSNKIGRNDPCPCGATNDDGSPVKYKKCCLDSGWKNKQIEAAMNRQAMEKARKEQKKRLKVMAEKAKKQVFVPSHNKATKEVEDNE
jgi:hypothetical protein